MTAEELRKYWKDKRVHFVSLAIMRETLLSFEEDIKGFFEYCEREFGQRYIDWILFSVGSTWNPQSWVDQEDDVTLNEFNPVILVRRGRNELIFDVIEGKEED